MKNFVFYAVYIAFLSAFISCGDDKEPIEEPIQTSNTRDTVK